MRPLFLTQTVAAVGIALDSAKAEGRIAVIDWPRLGRQLGERRGGVLQISPKLRSLSKQDGDRLYASPAALPLADDSVGAVVSLGLGEHAQRKLLLAEYLRVVSDGGVIVMVDRSPWNAMTQYALCAGLSEIEQRAAGRTVVTSGRAFAIPTPVTDALTG